MYRNAEDVLHPRGAAYLNEPFEADAQSVRLTTIVVYVLN